MRNYNSLFEKLINYFGKIELINLTNDRILLFLNKISEGNKQPTKRLRYSLLSAFFNFIKSTIDPEFQNPCDHPMLKKLFRNGKPTQWTILEKETVDEIIFRTENPRNRLILELMARGGMRIGEVLKLTPNEIEDRKVVCSWKSFLYLKRGLPFSKNISELRASIKTSGFFQYHIRRQGCS